MKYFIVLFLTLKSSYGVAQVFDQNNSRQRLNTLKVNITSIALKTYSLALERHISSRLSVQIGYSKNCYTGFFKTQIGEKVISVVGLDEDYEKYYKDYKTGNYSLTGEFRFYMRKKQKMEGMYLGLYGRYTRFDLDNVEFTFETSDGAGFNVPLINNLTGIGGGLLLGSQWLIKGKISVDLYIIGGHYGKLTGSLKSNKDLSGLSNIEKLELKQDIEDFRILNRKYVTAEVDDNGLNGKVNGPFFGVRAAGLNIGFRF